MCLLELALGRVDRCLAAKIEDVYAILALTPLAEQRQLRSRPVFTKQIKADGFEIVVIVGDRKTLRDGHGSFRISISVSAAGPNIGRETPRRDIELINRRLREVEQIAKEGKP